MPTKNLKDFCPGSLLEGGAEILKIFGWHFGRNDYLPHKFILNLTDLYEPDISESYGKYLRLLKPDTSKEPKICQVILVR